MSVWDKVVKILAAGAGAVLGIWKGWDVLVKVLVVVMALDYLTGCMVAIAGKSPKTESGGLSSKAGFTGLLKKVAIGFIVFLGYLLDQAMGMAMWQTAAVTFYLANEGLSVLENAALLNLPIPEKIKKMLAAMKEKDGEPPEDPVNTEK